MGAKELTLATRPEGALLELGNVHAGSGVIGKIRPTSARHNCVYDQPTDCVELIKWHQRRRRWTSSLHREFSSTDLNERRPTTRVRYPPPKTVALLHVHGFSGRCCILALWALRYDALRCLSKRQKSCHSSIVSLA